MSSPPHNYSPNHTENSFLGLLDDPDDTWPFLGNNMNDVMEDGGFEFDSSIFAEQEQMALMAELSIDEQDNPDQDFDSPLPLEDLQERSNIKSVDATNMVVEQDQHHPRSLEGGSSSRTKKRNHRLKSLQADKDQVELPNGNDKDDRNAKERVRRMKLNASYLGLGALLPHFRRSKKRWSAPIIIDRVAEYIPELENEIEKLTVKKANMLAVIANDDKQNPGLDQQVQYDQAPTVTVHEVKRGEVIVQICMNKRRDHQDHDHEDHTLSNIVQKVEAEGMRIVDASTVSVCDDGVCSYHLHIQMDESSVGPDYNIGVTRDKVISWLA